ncbi:MAG TPA: hypothetical protein VKC61_08280 [Pyrinomonadaceae bacterium]|nr:hypothetical protein [Pyrinomonadaceae bacterium]
MQDSKKQRPDSGVVDSEATSKETLADLNKNEQGSNSESGSTARESKVPSPDGGDDEVLNKTDEVDPDVS